jgi:dienelactone hydrolase
VQSKVLFQTESVGLRQLLTTALRTELGTTLLFGVRKPTTDTTAYFHCLSLHLRMQKCDGQDKFLPALPRPPAGSYAVEIPRAGRGIVSEIGPYPESPTALEDAQRTLGLVRFHAAEWHIDPHKIGVLGFSAGGHMVAAISTHFKQRLYQAVDAADKESCRPDFAVAIYPGHLSLAANSLGLNPDIHVTRQTPPAFLLQNEDDPVDRVEHSLSYYAALKKAGVPVEMHLYAQGGHAFGLRRTTLPVTGWPQLVETWLGAIGMIPANR